MVNTSMFHLQDLEQIIAKPWADLLNKQPRTASQVAQTFCTTPEPQSSMTSLCCSGQGYVDDNFDLEVPVV